MMSWRAACAALGALTMAACQPAAETGEPETEAPELPDVSGITSLFGEQDYHFVSKEAHNDCSMRWETVGELSDRACDICDLVFEVTYSYQEQEGDCSGFYDHPEPEDAQGWLGFVLSAQDGEPLVGPVSGGSLEAPSSAGSSYEVEQEDPLRLSWTYGWSHPYGYYHSHAYWGTAVLE